jgi:hypothetical protein
MRTAYAVMWADELPLAKVAAALTRHAARRASS